MDVEIELSLARWDHLARLDTSWMCWLELITSRVGRVAGWWCAQGLTSIWMRVGRPLPTTNQPGPTVFVDQAGDQARPGLGKR